jgi:hypothetical protein
VSLIDERTLGTGLFARTPGLALEFGEAVGTLGLQAADKGGSVMKTEPRKPPLRAGLPREGKAGRVSSPLEY